MLVLTDSTHVVCVVIFACYVIWGLNLTIRLVPGYDGVRGNRITLSDTEANLEGRGNTPRRIGPFFRKYHRDASRLQRFMHGPGLVPPTSSFPTYPPRSLRMARFCFPQAPLTASPPPDAVFFSPTTSSSHELPLRRSPPSTADTHDPFNDHDHTADSVQPFGIVTTHTTREPSFGMLNFEDAMSVEVVGESVPESPPPSYEEVERAERAAGGKDDSGEDGDESVSSSSDSLV
ncbi:hypothetical protein BC629DRAFT_1567153 [Irpex lacteus]|nr:hypothetical protein BC629DRAFT_1567153 [Irpex lacteus]